MAIETATEIFNLVSPLVNIDDFDVDDTISYINKGLKEIAGIILLPKLLEVETTIDTVVSTSYADLPTNFMRNLHYCYSNDTNRKIRIYLDLRLLYSEFSQLDLSGQVVGVARKGDKLYYQRIPSAAETLRIHYYKYPTDLATGTSTPDCLPEFLVRPLLVNYVAKEVLLIASDERSSLYETKYRQALEQLSFYVGPEPRERQEIGDDLNLEGYL